MSATALCIVGYGCRFPGGAVDGPSFWNLLRNGCDAITTIPADRWNADVFFNEHGSAGTSISRWGGFLNDIDGFEPACFGLSPREARYLDPQQRLLLEMAFEACEHAGLPIENLRGSRTGVFVGISTSDYGQLQHHPQAHRRLSAFTAQGCAISIAANRLSYCFDLRGPSFSLDTACSSSITAMDRGVKSLRSGESDCVLVGGVNLILNPEAFISFSAASMLSPDGRCKAFDASANGFVRSEGGAVIVMKRLQDAVRDGDPIRAVVVESGVNQDGRTNGIAMPNFEAQRSLLKDVYFRAKVDPASMRYIEAHGTGTAIGDPTEAESLGQVFSANRAANRPLILGSVKTNVGHLEAGSGMASIIKALLMIEHREIPRNLHFSEPNPHIRFEQHQLQVAVEHQRWPAGEPIRIGINSFGFGGANAHLLLAEYTPVLSDSARPRSVAQNGALEKNGSLTGDNGEPVCSELAERRDLPLVVTARSPELLQATARLWSEEFAEFERQGIGCEDVLYTAAQRRAKYEYRLGMAGASFEEFRECLDAHVVGETRPGMHAATAHSSPPKIAFVFCGQGPQWAGMGLELARTEPVFREALEECHELIRAEAGWSLLDELAKEEEISLVHRTDITQPALFAIHAALATLWRAWDVVPDLVFGHSVGEIGAAYAAGGLSLASAVRIVCHRGHVLQEFASTGAMLAVAASENTINETIRPFGEKICIAAVNAPDSATLAGESFAIERLAEALTQRGVWCKQVKVAHAFHSPLVDAAREPFLGNLGTIGWNAPVCEMISTVTGEPLDSQVEQGEYWWQNIRRPVRFFSAVEAAVRQEARVFVEIGPHPVLNAFIRRAKLSSGLTPVVFPSLIRDERDARTILSSLAALMAEGVSVELNGIFPRSRSHVDLPPHPWNRERFWHESWESHNTRIQPDYHPLLGERVADFSPQWNKTVDRQEQPWLADHALNGQVIFPAAGFVELSLAAATQTLGTEQVILDEFDIQRALFLPPESPAEVRVTADDLARNLTISSRVGGPKQPWTKHSQTNFRPFSPDPPASLEQEVWRDPSTEFIAGETIYAEFARLGFAYGPAFAGIRSAVCRGETALAEIELDQRASGAIEKYLIHPGVLDACFQTLLVVIPRDRITPGRVFLPERCRRVRLFQRVGPRVRSKVRLKLASDFVIRVDISIYDEDGQLAIDLLDFQCRGVSLGGESVTSIEEWTYETRWAVCPLRPAVNSEAIAMLPRLGLKTPLQTIVAEAETDAVKIWGDMPFDYTCQGLLAQNRLAEAYFTQFLHTLEANRQEAIIDPRALVETGRLVETHRPLLQRCLDRMAATGSLRRDGERWHVVREITPPDIAGIWRDVLSQQPLLYPMLRLLELCAGRLEQVLAGTLDPLEVFFAEEGFSLLNQVYSDMQWSQYSNTFIRNTLRELRKSLPANRPLRVLEVGAGTGGTAGYVLSGWGGEDGEYWFTDISAALVARAKDQFQQYEFVQYQTLDLERDFAEQGSLPNSFDVIIAVDVLHAVGDLGAALNRCWNALSAGGILLVRELTETQFCWDLVFGLMKGWWSYQGDPLRPAGPLLHCSEWESLLTEVGFEDIHASRSSQSLVPLGAVLAARRPLADQVQSSHNKHFHALGESNGQLGAESAKPRGNWLIFSDETVGLALLERLRSGGGRCISVRMGAGFENPETDDYRIDPGSLADMERLREQLGELKEDLQVVHLYALEQNNHCIAAQDVGQCEARTCHSLMHLFQVFALDHKARPAIRLSRMIIATQGACAMSDEAVPAPLAGMLHGLARVIASEFNETTVQVIDLDPEDHSCAALFAEIVGDEAAPIDRDNRQKASASAKPQAMAVWRGGRRFVPRLEPITPHSYRDAKELRAFELAVDRGGDISALSLTEIDPPPPGPGEVQVRVRYIPLNFRDLLRILGRYPVENTEDGRPGDECSGLVTAVGPGVDKFAPGDRVVCLRCGFRSLINVSQNHISHVPDHLWLVNAASMINSYLTGYCSLLNVGQLKAEDAILIHSAAGGVGLGAVQIAANVGAKVFATAGSEPKRRLLEKYGVAKIMNSRTLAFYDEILDATDGRGVDVVLNSLSGQAMMRSLSCVAPYGRFLELGKRDFFENTRVGLYPFHANVAFHAVYLGAVLVERPEVGRQILSEIFSDYSLRKYPPLLSRLFPVSRLNEALRLMSKGEHMGKLIVDMSQHWSTIWPKLRLAGLKPDASYIITGAFGGVGLVVARWLVQRGARHLTMLSRSGATTDFAREIVEELRAQGATIRVECCDVADPVAVNEILAAVREDIPLAGVFHLAMVLDDERLVNLDAERFHRVMRPKVQGGWNLHRATLRDDLDLFVMFSSISAAVGNYGQGPYAAGNAALESLVQHRRSLGLAGTAIQWGAIGEVGYVAQHQEVADMLLKLGFKTISPSDIAEALDRALDLKSDIILVNRIDWRRFAEFFPHLRETPGLFTKILSRIEGPHREQAAGDLLEEMQAAPGERERLAREFVTNAAARILGTSPAKLDLERPLTEMGLDSLMAVELVNVFEGEFKVSLPISAISRDVSILQLSATLLSVLFGEDEATDAYTESASPLHQDGVQLLRAADAGRPLFVFYSADGSLDIYRELVAALRGEFPIIGFSSVAISTKETTPELLEQLAADCAQTIVQQNEKGPVRLAGFSFGGALAVQTARRLEELGHEVEFLGVIDSLAPVGDDDTRARQLVEFLCQTYSHIQAETGFVKAIPAEQLQHEAGEIAKSLNAAAITQWFVGEHLAEGVSKQLAHDYVNQIAARVVLQQESAALISRLNVPIYCWAASAGLGVDAEDWAVFTDQGVRSYTVAADHFSILKQPAVEVLAGQMNDAMESLKKHDARAG